MKYTGSLFQGARVDSIRDVPGEVRKRWRELTLAQEQLERLERRHLELEFAVCPVGMPNQKFLNQWDKDRMTALRAVIKATETIRKESGMVQPYDEQFCRYWESYPESKRFALQLQRGPDGRMMKEHLRFEMPDGRMMTQYQMLVEELRQEIIGAMQRLKASRHERYPRRHNLFDPSGGESSLDSEG